MKLKWIAVSTAAIAALGAALWVAGVDLGAVANIATPAEKAVETRAIKPPAITVVSPQPREFVQTTRVTGSIVPREEVLVAPQVEGQRIVRLHVDAGDHVEEGQILATLATENLDALAAQNRATIARAEAGIEQAKSSILQAEARLEEAQKSLDRAKPLSRSGYLADSTLDQRQSAATSARAALQIARDSLKLAESEKVQAEAKQRELDWRRSRTEIKAPVAGLILSRDARIGAIATSSGEPMFRIARDAEFELAAEATSEQLPFIESGQPVTITVPGLPAIEAKVRLVAPRVDMTTRLGTVRIFIGKDSRLRVGTFASGAIITATSQGLSLPAAAIMRDDEGAYVQAVVAGVVEVKRIEPGLRTGAYTEIAKGLTSTDQIVAKAGTFLSPGERVTPVSVNEPDGGGAKPTPASLATVRNRG